jgi:LPXTG-motif cell wall-anchored protein
MIRKTFVLMAVIGAFFVSAVGIADAQDCGYGGCTTTTTSTPGGSTTTTTESEIPTITVVRGETVTIDGQACAPGATVTVTWDDGTVLGTFTADENGEFSTTITIPKDATLGVHLVTATCGDVEQFINVNVLAENVDNVDNGTLPRTGSSSTMPLVAIGGAALVLGGAFLYGARRPRNA